MIEHYNSKVTELFKLNDKFHRSNGPTMVWKQSGDWVWYLYGQRHRYYGPQHIDGIWYIHGKWISK